MGNVTTRKEVIQKPYAVFDNKNMGESTKIVTTFHDDSMEDLTWSNPEKICSPWLQQKHWRSWQEWWPTSKLQVGSRTSKEVISKNLLLSLRFGLLETFIIYKHKGRRISSLDVLLTLAESLSSGVEWRSLQLGIPNQKSPEPSWLLGHCFPHTVPGTSKKKPTRRFVVCWANGNRKQSSYWCPDCEKALCVVLCFQVYHTDRNLKIYKNHKSCINCE